MPPDVTGRLFLEKEIMNETGVVIKYETVFQVESLSLVAVLSKAHYESEYSVLEYQIHSPLKWDTDRSPIAKYCIGSLSRGHEPTPEEVRSFAAKKAAEKQVLDEAEKAYEAWMPQAYSVLEKALSHLEGRVRLEKQPWRRKIAVKVTSKTLEKELGGNEFTCGPTTDWQGVLTWLEKVRKIAPPPLPSGKPKPVLKRR